MGNYSEAHICQCLTRLATLRRDNVVTISGNRQKTGNQFTEGVFSLARALLQLGLSTGDIVAISAFNSDLYLEWLLAIALIGGIAAPLNYRWSFEEAKLAMLVVRPVMLVTDESCQCRWYLNFQNDDIPSLRWHVSLNSHSSDFTVLTTEMLKKQSVSSLPLNYCWANEGAVIICFTSGTTGKPKGVTLSHSALIIQSLSKIAIVGYGEDDVYLHTAPLCHIGGLSSAMAMLMVGGCHVLIPKFEPKSALEVIDRHKVTSLISVPAIMADIISLIRQKETWKGKETVNKILNGGGGLSIELIKDATLFFPRAKILSAYGGYLSYFLSPRYWGEIPAKATDFSNESWFDTGDVGSIDEHGNVWLIGRVNGKIKSGGENIYPEEVEGILLQHPGVVGIVIVGIPDARLTEMVVSCIQLRENWHWSHGSFEHSSKTKMPVLSGDILRRYCREKNLTGFKIPKIFILWSKPFPATTTGKIKRDQVRREVMYHLQSLPSSL
uniref:AMP-dependent synthetase/ligase domain-containing protein n=1 Tax=Fagus sylvatica TaxID=28930 RepID=A0A2N9J765_FAGSY